MPQKFLAYLYLPNIWGIHFQCRNLKWGPIQWKGKNGILLLLLFVLELDPLVFVCHWQRWGSFEGNPKARCWKRTKIWPTRCRSRQEQSKRPLFAWRQETSWANCKMYLLCILLESKVQKVKKFQFWQQERILTYYFWFWTRYIRNTVMYFLYCTRYIFWLVLTLLRSR